MARFPTPLGPADEGYFRSWGGGKEFGLWNDGLIAMDISRVRGIAADHANRAAANIVVRLLATPDVWGHIQYREGAFDVRIRADLAELLDGSPRVAGAMEAAQGQGLSRRRDGHAGGGQTPCRDAYGTLHAMSPELDRKLCERHPKIFANRHGDPDSTAMCRGFECGDGWYALIDALCGALQRETDLGNAPQLVAAQVKEKFGTLRFYTRHASERQRGMIQLAEAMSARICEVCGAFVEPDGNTTPWERARCPRHTESS